MNGDRENFDGLRQLLALKRHEQPPPGYFSRFSGEVVGRIKAGETGGEANLLEWLMSDTPWLRRIREALEAKPVFAGVFGAAVCALLVAGLVYSEQVDPSSTDSGVTTAQATTPFAGSPSLAVLQPLGHGQITALPTQAPSSTNPVAPTTGSLFDQFQLQATPVNFGIPER